MVFGVTKIKSMMELAVPKFVKVGPESVVSDKIIAFIFFHRRKTGCICNKSIPETVNGNTTCCMFPATEFLADFIGLQAKFRTQGIQQRRFSDAGISGQNAQSRRKQVLQRINAFTGNGRTLICLDTGFFIQSTPFVAIKKIALGKHYDRLC